MKQVEFQGSMYSVPEWANYIATDADGTVCVYETKPEYINIIGHWRDGGEWEIVYPVTCPFVACEAI